MIYKEKIGFFKFNFLHVTPPKKDECYASRLSLHIKTSFTTLLPGAKMLNYPSFQYYYYMFISSHFTCTASPSKAAWCINFLGIQPTFTHVPPRPHFEPRGDGVT